MNKRMLSFIVFIGILLPASQCFAQNYNPNSAQSGMSYTANGLTTFSNKNGEHGWVQDNGIAGSTYSSNHKSCWTQSSDVTGIAITHCSH